jgi:hypothetical protein
MRLRAIADSDQLLLDEMLRPPPLEQARRSLEFWQRRRRRLPLYRWNARKEADEMIRRCRERLIAAERLHYGTGVVGIVRRLLAFEPPLWRFRWLALTMLVWRAVPRRLSLALVAAASAALLLAFAVGVVLIALVLQAI